METFQLCLSDVSTELGLSKALLNQTLHVAYVDGLLLCRVDSNAYIFYLTQMKKIKVNL